MNEQRTTYRGTAYVRRTSTQGTRLTPAAHQHRWQTYPPDPRFEYCVYCPERRMAEWTRTPLPPAPQPEQPRSRQDAANNAPFQAGDHVRVADANAAAYPPVYRNRVGVAEKVQTYRTAVRRWLVSFSGYGGRYQVREEHLVRAESTETEEKP